MRVVGLPETLWFVISPTANSELGDICYECDFDKFALQIRGGLDERKIVGIFADEGEAKELAEKLLATIQQPSEDADVHIHKSPGPNGLPRRSRSRASALLTRPPARKSWSNLPEIGAATGPGI